MRRTTALLLALAVTAAPVVARADGRAAAAAFAEGERAFAAGDFLRAGGSFEAAYREQPHWSPLWNAARSYHRARDSIRAANLYAKYLREAPADAKDRDQATAALAELAPTLARLEVHTALRDVKVDGARLEAPTVWVAPGEHLVEGASARGLVRKVAVAREGQVSSVSLVEDPAPPPPMSATAPEAARSRGLPLVVPLVVGGLAVAAGGATVWSGIDTLAQRRAFDDARTQENLDEGKSRQLRTNVLLAVTGGLVVATGVTLLFVDFGGARTAVALGPGSVTLAGALP
ncbi:MAG: hypothetical protein JNL38_21775 [Myxococcales bacterium]|nr:hypothetical protein [Myxococcales bacterium]